MFYQAFYNNELRTQFISNIEPSFLSFVDVKKEPAVAFLNNPKINY
jgi:hypothetical protein